MSVQNSPSSRLQLAVNKPSLIARFNDDNFESLGSFLYFSKTFISSL